MVKNFNQTSAIRGALRRTFSRSPIVREVLSLVRREVPKFNKDGARAKKDSVEYQCAVCQTWTKSTAISVDHKVPVIDISEGFVDWNVFVDRLFCGRDNLQSICDTCHDKKTYKEKITRLIAKYTRELDDIESQIDNTGPQGIKPLAKELGKYITKKKTKDLESIAQRAEGLKRRLL
jgi:5-methylcytosine-specific restriction endonuclease McrA